VRLKSKRNDDRRTESANEGVCDSLKICDLTQFYSPFSGGVKRYVHEKTAYIDKYSPTDEHVLIVPGQKTEMTSSARSRVYSIHSPLLSRASRYRALLNLRAVEEILEQERPDIIESSDPYQVGWKAISAQQYEVPWQTREPSRNEIDARLCAQAL